MTFLVFFPGGVIARLRALPLKRNTPYSGSYGSRLSFGLFHLPSDPFPYFP